MLFQIKVFLNDGNLLMTYNTSEWYNVQYQLLGVFNNPQVQRCEVYRNGELIGEQSR